MNSLSGIAYVKAINPLAYEALNVIGEDRNRDYTQAILNTKYTLDHPQACSDQQLENIRKRCEKTQTAICYYVTATTRRVPYPNKWDKF